MIKCLDFFDFGLNGVRERDDRKSRKIRPSHGCNAIMTLLQENLEGKSQWHMQHERKIDTILDSTH